MATSGTRTFNPDFGELLTEALSRIGVRGVHVSSEHIDEAVRSANLLFIEMANRVQHQFQMRQFTLTTVEGQAQYSVPAGVIEIFKLVHRRDGSDTPMWPMSRADYLVIPDKDNEGRPVNYFFDRGAIGNTQRTITTWPVPDRAGDEFVAWGIYRPEDALSLPENIGIAWEWFDAYAGKLTARLAEKFVPELFAEKNTAGELAFQFAKQADRERAPMRLRMRGYVGRGSGGRFPS